MKLTRLFGPFALSCLFALAARAADFEGTLKWTISAEVTDPALKAQMADAQKQMADPAKLAQMKAALENPQMKAMMEQNPQMKAAMEAQIKMAEDAAAGKSGGDMLTSMMPKAVTIRTKAAKTHMTSEGGAMPMEVITLPASPVGYWIDRKARTFTTFPSAAAKTDKEKTQYKVTKGTGSTKILGYTCEEYLVEAMQQGATIHNRLWATDDIPGLDAKALAKARFGGDEANYLTEINGVPLKMEITTPQVRMTMLAASVKAGAVSDEEFVVPADFVEKASPAAAAAAAAKPAKK